MRQARTARRGQAGTAALETMIVMSFLFTLIFGFVHICLFVVTKSMTNYAAFTASRALLVGGTAPLSAAAAMNLGARQVMSELQWWGQGNAYADQARALMLVQTNQQGPRLAGGRRRRGVRVTYLLPFGYPVFRGGLGLVRAVGFAPTTTSHTSVPEEGDNR